MAYATGGDVGNAAITGTIIGGATGFLASEEFGNMIKGKGFNSNNNVLKKFVSQGQQQEALEYFGFEGKYNPNRNGRKLPEYDEVDGYYGSTTVVDGISYGDYAFSSYDNLKATYYKESYHYNKVKANIPFSKQEVPEGLQKYHKVFPEESEGFIYQYKNKGLYSNTTINSMSQINFYQNGIFDLDISQYYLPKWWHFVYKIPRRW